MTDTGQRPRTGTSAESGAARTAAARQGARGDTTARGRTTIADNVVVKIAGMAAREVMGVHAMGGGMSRSLGAVRDRVPGGGGTPATRGVKAEVGEIQAALDLQLVVEYGVSVIDVARDVRQNVIGAVERMTGLEVVEVNIDIDDVKLPDEEEEEPRIR